MLNDTMVNQKIGKRGGKNYPMYVYSEGIKLPDHLTEHGKILLIK